MRKFLSFIVGFLAGYATFIGIKYLGNPEAVSGIGFFVISAIFPLMACLIVTEYDQKMGFDVKRTILVSSVGLTLLMLFIGVISSLTFFFSRSTGTGDLTLVDGILFLAVMAVVGLVTGSAYSAVSKLYLAAFKH